MCKYNKLFDCYLHIVEDKILKRKFSYTEFKNIINKHQTQFEYTPIGKSVNQLSINSYTIGSGKTKILLWSQMHGNEPSCTLALLDIMNYLESEDAKPLLQQVTIKIIPLLNPDGNEIFSRRNALGIDLNRDAQALVSPESQILNKIAQEFKPEFAFNLHDQEQYYTTLPCRKQTIISFLSPKSSAEETIPPQREKAMKVISEAYSFINQYIPNQIGKYNDDFTPTAFGEKLTMMGISTILVECGAKKDDINRIFPRKIVCLSIIRMLQSIANKDYTNADINIYKNIPNNIRDNTFDLLIKNITVEQNNYTFKADIGIRRYKGTNIEDFADYSNIFRIEGFGDLSQYGGINIYDATNDIIKQNNTINIGEIANINIQTPQGNNITIQELLK
ncbi:MAG: hypothetical protein MJ211_12750 [Bacteroidales bacterium]|nr:hypothetical protein [Bacteroidales bacterium]